MRELKPIIVIIIAMGLVLCGAEGLFAKTGIEASANIKAALEGREWPVYVIARNMIKGQIKSLVKKDILTFKDDAVFSELLSSQGYSEGGSVYRARQAPGGGYIWESILLHENQTDTALMKGELKDGVMKGVIVYQEQGGPNRTVNFTTIEPK